MRWTPTPRRATGFFLVVGCVVGGVWLAASGVGDSTTQNRGATPRTEVNVLAASSLSSSFTEIATAFESIHPGVRIVNSFAGSATLAAQIRNGAPADVVAMADSVNMDKIVATGDVVASTVSTFATNTLAIVVAAGNPRGIATVADLVRPGIVVSLCDEAQPCGRYAREMFDKAGVDVRATSLETSAASVLGRVARGEADAGVVYVTDGAHSSEVDVIAIPDAINVIARYPIGLATRAATERSWAERYLEFVLSPKGRNILGAAGFVVS